MTPGGEDAETLNLVEICAELVRHNKLTPDQIEKLDRWWVAYVYWCPRGKLGELKITKKARSDDVIVDPKEQFWAIGKSLGWPDFFIEFRWAKAQTAATGKAE